MKIAVACDHGGLLIKEQVKEIINRKYEAVDLGTDSDASVDYADLAFKALEALKGGEVERIVLICGTGIGMSLAANRVKGVRGTLCHDAFTAQMSREHNDSNCLVLGARTTGPSIVEQIVEIWLETPFEGGRHQQRIDKLDTIVERLG